MDQSFLPAWPLNFNDFLLFGTILLVGLVGGHLASRTPYIPKITGYIAAGFIFGHSVLDWIDPQVLERARLFVDISLGLILFQLGQQLDLDVVRHDRSIVLTSVLESALSFLFIFLALLTVGISPLYAALAGAAGISASPAVVLLVVRELDARGPVTDRALTLVALNNVIAFFAFASLLPFVHFTQNADWATIVLQPLYAAIGSVLLGYGMALMTIRLARMIGKSGGGQFALLVGVIITSIGLAKAFEVSLLLTLLVLGILARNLDRRQHVIGVDFGHTGQIFFLILFVVAGANLHVGELLVAGAAAVTFVVARFLGKAGAIVLLARAGGLSTLQAGLLSLTMLPMAGLAIGLTATTTAMYPEFGAQLSTIILAAVAILETIGPIATEFALKRAGEVEKSGTVEH